MMKSSILGKKKIEKNFFACEKNDLIKYHLTLGRHIRNKYNLWSLKDEEKHPDTISMKIIEKVWEKERH